MLVLCAPFASTATGGTVTTLIENGVNYTVHTFTSGGTFNSSLSMNVSVLVVAGGGQGGRNGGGGAGGLIYNSSYPVSAQAYSVTVGAGGNAYSNEQGANGGNSVFGVLTAIGGGGGAGRDYGVAGKTGGSGGGGGGSYAGEVRLNPGSGTSGQGYSGGSGAGDYSCASSGGGGGGSGAAGSNGVSGAAGKGGNGRNFTINGTNVYYAGGGGGSIVCQGSGSNGAGGLGGGGAGYSAAGTANTGGGGGGQGKAGGSGIVIIRYVTQVPPEASNFSGESSNLSGVPDLSNVANLTLDIPGKGKIRFPAGHTVNAIAQDYDSNVLIGNGFISVNSSALHSSFNSTASLTMNLTGIYSGSLAPDIYYYSGFAENSSEIVQNGELCIAPKCTGISWNQASSLLTFNVSGFSGYGVDGSELGGSSGSPSNSSGTIGINITSTNQIAVYTSNSMNDSTFSFVPVTPPAAGSVILLSNETTNTTDGELGFIVENQGNVNVSITVASDKDAANFIGGSSPLFQMFGGANESGACPSLNTSMQDLSGSEITVCPSLAYADSQDTIWAYVLVKIDSDSPPQTSTATLTFTSTQV
ncbi:MAG: glycine-rich domain-containing protein [Candidatus Micrarchaeia archaeon]